MANLENNNDKEKDKSITKKVGDAVRDTREFVHDAVEHPVETAGEFVGHAAKEVTTYAWWAKLLLVLFWTSLFIIIAGLIAVNLPATKNWAAKKVVEKLNRDLKSQMSFERVEVNYFGEITIHNVAIKDYKNYKFLTAKKLYANSDWFSILSDSKNLQFQSLSVDQMNLHVITYKNDSISNFIRFTQLFNKKPSDPNQQPFQLKSRVFVKNSKVSIVNQNKPYEQGRWLNAENVNLIVPELKVYGNNVSAQINNLNFVTERWGKKHYLKTFTANLSYTDNFLLLKNLTLQTDRSLLQGALKFSHDKKNGFTDFADKVWWDMNLERGSLVSGYDISYFATNWDNPKAFNISGQMTGPLNRFYLENFVFGNSSVSIATSTMKLQNLLKGNFQIESNDLSTDFTYKDLKAMFPTFISSKMKNFADDFGRLRFTGAAKVTPHEVFIPKGRLITGIGQAKISNLYLDDYSTKLPKYRGYVEVNDLNSSVITKNNQVGLISGKFNVEGESFDVNTMRIKTRSQISRIDILNKEINNVFLDGFLDHKKYRGIINVNDEQAKADVKGFIDFSTKKILADVTADVKHLNISYFTGNSSPTVMNGFVVGKISMINLNDMTLDADLNNLNFINATQNIYIPNAMVKAYFENGNRVLAVDAPGAIDGQLAGKFNLGDLQGMIQNGLEKILVGPAPIKLYRGQNVNMDFNIQQGLVNIFEPNIKILRGAKITGVYDGNSNNLVLNVDASSVNYLMTRQREIADIDETLATNIPDSKSNGFDKSLDSAMVEDLTVRINTANLNEQIFAKVSRLEYDQNIFKDVTLSGRNENQKTLHLAATFNHGTPEEEIDGTLKPYAININQSYNNQGDYVFRFEPTDLRFNNITWRIDTSAELDHSITYRKKSGDFLIHNLRLYSDNSELLVNNALFKSAKDFSLIGEVKNFSIDKIFGMQKEGNKMDIQGLANGTFNITMSKSNLEPIIDLTVDDIVMQNRAMGDLIISAKSSNVRNVYDIDAHIESTDILGKNQMALSGTVNNNTPSPTVDLLAKLRDFDIKFTEQFMSGVFSNLRGKATGDLKIVGQLNDIDYSGDIALKGFGLKLNFTGVDYSFADTVVPLSKGLAILNNIEVRDGRQNSHGTLSGAIQFETLASMGVNLIMRADNLLLLNTTQKDYDLFWGRVYGDGALYVSGPVSSLDISTPNMRALTGSTFTFNSNSTSNVDEFKMLRFLKEDKAGMVVTEKKKKSGANMNVDFTVAVDRGTNVNVLVGDDVGDISVRGTSDALRFQMTRTGNISMNGSYIVDNGTFVSKAILERTFQIEKNSNMVWDGNAVTPALDITANYRRAVSNLGDYLNAGSLPPVDILLTTKINGTLNNPKVSLDVTAPDISGQLKETLAGKMTDEGEKVIQFGSILVLNSFNVQNSAGFNLDIASSLESSGYNILFKQLGSVLNTISNEFQVDLNYIQGDQASNTGDRANTSVRFILSPRVTIKTGVGIPISKTEAANQQYLSGEGIIEYDFSKKNDGTKVFRVYSKPSNIGLVGNSAAGNPNANQTYGGGVVWSKNFNTIFKRHKTSRKRKDSATTITKDSSKISDNK